MHNRRRQEVEYKRKRKRLVLLTAGILFLIYLSLAVIFGENSFLRYVKLKSTKADLSAEIKGIKKQNEDIKGQIEALKKDPGMIEELAREQGLTKEGEWIFKYEDEE